MKFIRNILVAISILCMTFSCSVSKEYVPDPIEYGATIMQNAFEGYYTKVQFDSICRADTLKNDLGAWYLVPMKDDETKENVSQYLYIKSLGQNEIIYRVHMINPNKYKITKRITK